MSLYHLTTRRHHLYMTLTRNHALATQQALTNNEIAALAARCPEGQRWAFEGWLRGTHELNGDLIDTGDSGAGDNEDRGGI